jgi:acetyl esterase/lipase
VNIPTLMVKLAALQGRPLPISSRPAPLDTEDSTVIPADARGQIGAGRRVRSVRNVEFARREGVGRDGAALGLRLDLMIPKAPGRYPLVVYIPGGGFVHSVKAGGARMRRYLAAAGFVVASVEYRTIMHGATYRDGIADVRAAIGHLRSHADEYAIDPERVAVWGESAGGYLAAMIGVTDAEERRPGDGVVSAVVDKFGASSLDRFAEGFDDETAGKIHAPGNPLARYVHGPTGRLLTDDAAALKAADPLTHISPQTPPFLIFHGSDDRLVSPVQTSALHRALLAAGRDSTRYLIEGGGHGDLAVKGGEEKFWTTVPMMGLMIDFLRRTLSERSSRAT